MDDMFTGLNQIFVTPPPRQAENSDARMNIRRHDPEYHKRRKKKDDGAQDSAFDMDDTAMVSVEALEMFLSNFIKEQQSRSEAKPAPALEQNFKSEAGKRAAQKASRAAHAANAYQHSAQMGGSSGLLDTTDDTKDPDTPPTTSLKASPEEMRRLHALRDKVKKLDDRGVTYLSIEKQDSFVASLESAVDQALGVDAS